MKSQSSAWLDLDKINTRGEGIAFMYCTVCLYISKSKRKKKSFITLTFILLLHCVMCVTADDAVFWEPVCTLPNCQLLCGPQVTWY